LDFLIENVEQYHKQNVFNVLLALEYFQKVYFEKLINEYEQEERTDASKKITDESLSLKPEDQDWATQWLKLNFSNVEILKEKPQLQELRTAVRATFDNFGTLDTIINDEKIVKNF